MPEAAALVSGLGYKRPVTRLCSLVLLLGGCGFSVSGEGPVQDPRTDARLDAQADAPPIDAAVDAAPPPPPLLYAASNHMLYRLDVDAETSTQVGAFTLPPGPSGVGLTIIVGGLAWADDTLIGLTGVGNEILTIDPATAAVTQRRTLSVGGLDGLTVAPAGQLGIDAVVLAAAGESLRRIDPATGTVTTIGEFGQGMRLFSDLAWVKSQGLFATLTGGPCLQVCFARVDPTTGAATVFRSNLSPNLFGLSGYRDRLWAFNGAGPVLTVNLTTGLLAIAFDPLVPWTEAAQ